MLAEILLRTTSKIINITLTRCFNLTQKVCALKNISFNHHIVLFFQIIGIKTPETCTQYLLQSSHFQTRIIILKRDLPTQYIKMNFSLRKTVSNLLLVLINFHN